MNHEYEKEAHELKLRHILERKLVEFKGMMKTLKHNSKMKSVKSASSSCINKTEKMQNPLKNDSSKEKNSNVDEVIEITLPEQKWTPSTTKEDIENIIKKKKLKVKSRHLSTTKVKVVSRKLKVGDEIPRFKCVDDDLVPDGTFTLQRYIHKSGRWRAKCEDGNVIHLTKEHIAFLFRRQKHSTDINFELVDRETIKNAVKEVDDKLNESCYVKVLKMILMILKPSVDFNFNVLYDISVSQNIECLFDDLDFVDVQVVDQILNVYDLQLKYFCPKSTHTTDIMSELLKMMEEPTYLSLIWYKDHYYLLGKWGRNFFLYNALNDNPIRCYYRDIIDLLEEGAKFFWVQELDVSYNLSDWLWDLYDDESVKGAVRRKRQLPSDNDDSDTSTFESDNPSKRSKVESKKSKQKNESKKSKQKNESSKKKRVSMKGWTQEQKDKRKKELQKIRNQRRKRKKKSAEDRVYTNRKLMTQEERDLHDKRLNDARNEKKNAKRKKRPEVLTRHRTATRK